MSHLILVQSDFNTILKPTFDLRRKLVFLHTNRIKIVFSMDEMTKGIFLCFILKVGSIRCIS